MHKWDVSQILAFGIIVWIMNRLGIDDRMLLILNILAAVVLVVFCFIL